MYTFKGHKNVFQKPLITFDKRPRAMKFDKEEVQYVKLSSTLSL